MLRSSKVTLRETYKAPGFRANFLVCGFGGFFGVLFCFHLNLKNLASSVPLPPLNISKTNPKADLFLDRSDLKHLPGATRRLALASIESANQEI